MKKLLVSLSVLLLMTLCLLPLGVQAETVSSEPSISIDELTDVLNSTDAVSGEYGPDCYDIDQNGIVEYDDLAALKYLLGEGTIIDDPLCTATGMDLLSNTDVALLQTAIVRGDSTRALYIDALDSQRYVTLAFNSSMDLSQYEYLQMDTLCVSGSGAFAVTLHTAAGDLDPVTATPENAAWSTVSLCLTSIPEAALTQVGGLTIELQEGNSVCFDNLRVNGVVNRTIEREMLIDFSTDDHRISQDANTHIWSNCGVLFTNLKTASSNAIVNNIAPIRLYKNSIVSLQCANMAKIVFVANTNDYAKDLHDAIVAAGYECTLNAKNVIVTFAEPINTFEIELTVGQVRLDKVSVTALVPADIEAFEVSFDPNYEDATDAFAPIEFTDGDFYGKLPAPADREGYIFGGWFTDPTCSGEAVTATAVVTETHKLYAKWIEIAEVVHDEVRHNAKAPTCTDIGWDAYVTCSRCDYTTYVEKSALGHTEVIDGAVAPDCTNTGLTEGKHCSVCNEVLVSQEILPIQHDSQYYINQFHSCSICGAIKYVEDYFVLTNLNDNEYSLRVKDPTNLPAEVIIPRNYKGKTITTLDEWAFDPGRDYLTNTVTSIYIPDSIVKIGMAAFQGCINITNITIPDGITEIDVGVFSNCKNLRTITIPGSVTSILQQAFTNCNNLTDIYFNGSKEQWQQISIGAWNDSLLSAKIHYGPTSDEYFDFILQDDDTYSVSAKDIYNIPEEIILPDTYNERPVTRIDDFAFSSCENLKTIIIPASITDIGGYAFSNCTSLTNIVLSDGLININYCAFSGCTSLKGIHIPSTVTNIGREAFSYCTTLTSITIPDSITSIPSGLFSGCYSLTKIKFSSSIRTIYASAFAYCPYVSDIYFKGTLEEWQAININDGNDVLVNSQIHFEEEYIESPHEYFEFTLLSNGTYSISAKNTNNLCNQVVIPSSFNGKAVTVIGEYAFYECAAITEVIIPDSITMIGMRAFEGCANLENVIIGDNVTEMGVSVFASCTSLTSITFPEKLTAINIGMFANCNNLQSIYIPCSVNVICDTVFLHCTNLTDIYYGGNEYQWQDVGIGKWNDPFDIGSINIHHNAFSLYS